MSSVLERPPAAPERPPVRMPTPVRRFGHLVAAMANVVLLWVAHQLLDWGWPGFLTEEFELVLGLVTASFIASIVVNLALAVRPGGRFRVLTDLVTAGFGLAVGLRMLEVFPFDFSGYANDWSGLATLAIVVGILATGIAIVVNLFKLAMGPNSTA